MHNDYYNDSTKEADIMEATEPSTKQAEEWLLAELNQAEQKFGEGEEIETFAMKYKLAEYRE